MGHKARLILCMALAVISQLGRAQFSVSSNDPTSVRWMSVSSDKFSVIYPAGCDSLGHLYLSTLEKYRPAVASSLLMGAGEYQKKPLPVILHTRNSASNGVVTWAPRRMELYTLPEWDNYSAIPWHIMLSIHEGRHAAQMQLGYRKVFHPFFCVFGEMIPGAAAAYPGRLLLEGDAVVAETALTNSGRGRSSQFLNYHNYAFDHGDYRSWMRWYLGSYYHYTPDKYAWGYMIISGTRVAYDDPMFMADFFDYVSRRPYNPWPLYFTLKRISGVKFKESYPVIRDLNYRTWAADTAARAPFVRTDTLSRRDVRETFYSHPCMTPDSSLYYVKRDLYHNSALYKMDRNGKTERLKGIVSTTSQLSYVKSDNSLVWNAVHRDARWGQLASTSIMRYSIAGRSVFTVTSKGNYVCPIEAGPQMIAAVNYLESGRERIDFIDIKSGLVVNSWDVPDALQLVHLASDSAMLYAVAITEGGCGIWSTDGIEWKQLLESIPVQIGRLDWSDGRLYFESDHNGEMELYSLDLSDWSVKRHTSSKYGGLGYIIAPYGDIFFSALSSNGSSILRVKKEEAFSTPVNWKNYHHYAVADKLSEQERSIASNADAYFVDSAAVKGSVSPEKYSKGAHAIHFHSFAPCYVDINAISSLSFDNIQNIASLGLMGMFQNSMSTLYGQIGYKAAPDSRGKWFNSGHLSLTYRGLYPVLEGQFHIGESNRIDYVPVTKDTVKVYEYSTPMIRASLSAYIPWAFNNGVRTIGLIPSVGMVWSNNSINGSQMLLFNAGLRCYIMQNIATACIYPRWGIGVEVKWNQPMAYIYTYGYVPGVWAGQGLRLSYLGQKSWAKDLCFLSGYASIMPRGLSKYASAYKVGQKITVDYTIPFNIGDWNIGNCIYCNRGILTPHFDYSIIAHNTDLSKTSWTGNLWSAGASFELEFGCLLWICVPMKVGVTYSYSGGSAIQRLNLASPHYVGATFSIELPN